MLLTSWKLVVLEADESPDGVQQPQRQTHDQKHQIREEKQQASQAANPLLDQRNHGFDER